MPQTQTQDTGTDTRHRALLQASCGMHTREVECVRALAHEEAVEILDRLFTARFNHFRRREVERVLRHVEGAQV